MITYMRFIKVIKERKDEEYEVGVKEKVVM